MPPKSRTASGARRPRRKEKKNVSHGQAHIKSTFNNTIVTSSSTRFCVKDMSYVTVATIHRYAANSCIVNLGCSDCKYISVFSK